MKDLRCGVRDAVAMVGVEERIFEAEGMVHVKMGVTGMQSVRER